jgi:hypothetical protein
MKRLLLAIAICALALPAQAAAEITVLDPSAPGSPTTAADAIMADPSQVTSALLPERAFGGSGAPSPLGVGDNTLGGDPPLDLAGFPTAGSTYGLLSSGDVNTIASQLTNTAPSTSFSFTDQFPLIPVIDRGPEAEDWTVLQINVNVPGGANCMALDYRFLSEEFPEFVGSQFNDAFIAEIDSTSWSVATGGGLTRPNDFAVSPTGNPISINGVGDTAVTEAEASGTYFDAATGLITTKTPIGPGGHAIFLSIFDASDQIYDSAIFLDNLRFINEDPSTCKPPTGQQIAPPPPGAPPAPPSNQFTPGPSVKFTGGGTQVTLTITVPGPGTLTAGSTAVGAAAVRALGPEAAAVAAAKKPAAKKCKPKGKKKGKKCKKKPKVKKPLVLNSTVRANQAGPVQITVKLSGTGKALLAKKGKLTVPITLTFTPDGGSPASQVRTVTFKKPAAKKCKKAKGKAKGGKKCKKPAKGKKK